MRILKYLPCLNDFYYIVVIVIIRNIHWASPKVSWLERNKSNVLNFKQKMKELFIYHWNEDGHRTTKHMVGFGILFHFFLFCSFFMRWSMRQNLPGREVTVWKYPWIYLAFQLLYPPQQLAQEMKGKDVGSMVIWNL